MIEIEIADVIQIILAVINTITFAVLLFTLLEMKRQRKSSYMPDIVPQDDILKIKYSSNKKGYFDWEISNINYKSLKSIKNKFYKFRILNVGLGNAKYVSYKFNSEFQDIIKRINKLDKDNEFKIELSIAGSQNYLNIKNKEYISMISLFKSQTIPLVYKDIEEKIKINFPLPLLELYLIYIYLTIKYDISNEIGYFPRTTLNFIYKDIEGNVHKKLFSVFLELILIDTTLKERVSEVSFNIKFKEI